MLQPLSRLQSGTERSDQHGVIERYSTLAPSGASLDLRERANWLPAPKGRFSSTNLGDGQQFPETRSRQALGGQSQVPVAVHLVHAEPARPDGQNHMVVDARTAYTYEAITVTEASTMNLVDACIQYLASYKGDASQWLDGAKTFELVVPRDVPMLNFGRSFSKTTTPD